MSPENPLLEWPPAIAEPSLALLHNALGTTERLVGGGPAHVFRHPASGEATGSVRVYDGEGLQALVISTAAAPVLRMYQAVAFAPPGSAIPHLSIDAKAGPAGCWFSVDLMPRVPVTEESAWTDHVYEPLSDLVQALHEREDMRQAVIRPRHRARLSPWLITMRLDAPSAVPVARDAMAEVTRRFVSLLQDAWPSAAVPATDPVQLAQRDARERAEAFSWRATSNYRFLNLIGGDDAADVVQRILQDPDVVPAALPVS